VLGICFFQPDQTGRVLFVLEKGPVRAFRTYVALHDGRLLTLDDTVEYFNVILGTKLTPQEKKDLVDFLCAL
jgi:hypothetical protein